MYIIKAFLLACKNNIAGFMGLGTQVADSMKGFARNGLHFIAHIFGEHLGWNIVDVFVPIAIDRSHKRVAKVMKESNQFSGFIAAMSESASRGG